MPLDSSKQIFLGKGLEGVPEELLLAHYQGKVLFITGAGVSMQSGMPTFRSLVLDVYSKLDMPLHKVLSQLSVDACKKCFLDASELDDRQAAEAKRFQVGDYDVALGMLERRIDTYASPNSLVRRTVNDLLRDNGRKHSQLHNSILSLSDRGGVTSLATTNFDTLFEKAAASLKIKCKKYSLGGIPRPSRSSEFGGIFHIHGVIPTREGGTSEIVLTDRDFGDYYLKRSTVSDFIYDAARLFNLVFVGYSAEDPPMQYLLNAIAADDSRFDDLKTRYVFVGSEPDAIKMEDWEGRGLHPIRYNPSNKHEGLSKLFKRWSELSPRSESTVAADALIKKLTQKPRSKLLDPDLDLFDYLVKRANQNDRARISKMISQQGASFDWLDQILFISKESSDARMLK